MFLKLVSKDENGALHETSVMAYVLPSTDKFYHNKAVIGQLQVIPYTFPQVRAAAAIETNGPSNPMAYCGCPVRNTSPGDHAHLPFFATAETLVVMMVALNSLQITPSPSSTDGSFNTTSQQYTTSDEMAGPRLGPSPWNGCFNATPTLMCLGWRQCCGRSVVIPKYSRNHNRHASCNDHVWPLLKISHCNSL